MSNVPIKPISEIEVKSEVSENDKILILDSESDEARLAPKDEIKGDKGDTGDTGPQGPQGIQGIQGEPGTDAWEYMTQAQYDSLPDTKLTDSISRMIYDNTIPVLRVLLRQTNNLLHYNSDSELYADLQLDNGLTPTSAFPVGINVGLVDDDDGWSQDGVLINAKTTDGTYVRWLYGADGKLYFDGGTGVFKVLATTDDITSALSTLSNSLATVAFSGKSSDLDNDAGFNSVPVMTEEEYEQQTGASGDDKRYFIYEEVN